jgi:hypothetical protein
MEQKIKDAYYETLLSSAKLAKKLDLPVSKVKKVLDKLEEKQITQTKQIRQSDYFTIESNPYMYQADLMFIDKYSRQNKGISILLNILNSCTRKAWVYPIKSKEKDEIFNAFIHFLKEIKYEIRTLTTDNGTEFTNKKFNQLIEKNNIHHYLVEPEDHRKNMRVERFNQTLRGMIKKYMVANDTLTFIDVLPKMVELYNDTPHDSLFNKSPNNIDELTVVKIMVQERKRNKKILKKSKGFNIGDQVRTIKKKKMFEKGRVTFNSSIHTITHKNRYTYYVDDETSRPYQYYELLKVGDVVKRPEKPKEDKFDTKEKHVNKERKIEKEIKLYPILLLYLPDRKEKPSRQIDSSTCSLKDVEGTQPTKKRGNYDPFFSRGPQRKEKTYPHKKQHRQQFFFQTFLFSKKKRRKHTAHIVESSARLTLSTMAGNIYQDFLNNPFPYIAQLAISPDHSVAHGSPSPAGFVPSKLTGDAIPPRPVLIFENGKFTDHRPVHPPSLPSEPAGGAGVWENMNPEK